MGVFFFFFGRLCFRFRGQTQLYKSTPSEFQMAIEEALLAENGILNKGFGSGESEVTNGEAYPCEAQEWATTSSQGQEYYTQSQSQSQVIVLRNYLFFFFF